MSNLQQYQLTANLIADCMALIPQNLERLNETAGHPIHFAEYSYKQKYADATDLFKFLIISHCLRTIPEFQVENPELKKYSDDDISGTNYLNAVYYTKKLLTPKTIASATLRGQGEFPPSTLEELCESYKNVISK